MRVLLPENIVYLDYSVASDRIERGILLTHNGSSELTGAQAIAIYLGVTDSCRVLQLASFNSVWDLIMPLVRGSSLILGTDRTHTDLAIREAIFEYDATVDVMRATYRDGTDAGTKSTEYLRDRLDAVTPANRHYLRRIGGRHGIDVYRRAEITGLGFGN